MKTNTNRIHRNGATAPAKSQAKIISERQPDAIRIVINDEDGKPFADFEIPTAVHSGMVQAAYAQKITVQQWIENAVRAKISRRQPATAARKHFGEAFRLPKDAANAACLCVFNREDQALVSKVPLTEDEYESLWHTATIKNKSHTAQFAADAIRLKLAMPSVFHELVELESARDQSNALHILLYDSMKSCEGGEFSDDIKCGIIELTSATHQRLEKAIETLRTMLSQPKTAEVAS